MIAYIVVLAYICLYLPIVKKIENWEEMYPNIIPFLSICGLVLFGSGVVALWPIWGWKTIFILV